jgi:glycosyltransferase involved in cell wall biosynthesis
MLQNGVSPPSLIKRPAATTNLEGAPRSRPLRVFVHLAYDKDPDAWRAALSAGTLVGRNDGTPYGYGRASSMGCTIEFSRSVPSNAMARIGRLGLRAAFGFDLAHAMAQRDRILSSDVVWTHTESQFLAVSALLRRYSAGPKLIGQAVWLLDRWPRLNPAHKLLFTQLIRQVDILTTLSPVNAEVARRTFPGTRVEAVRFGIPHENPIPPSIRGGKPIRVIAVGNDRHRDWMTLVQAVDEMPDFEVEILSGTAPRFSREKTPNITIRAARTNLELSNAYKRASVAVVPLLPNLHASGITAIQEALLAGVPVVATDTGGLRSYFGADEVRYVPAGSVVELRDAIVRTALRGEESNAMVERAQGRIINGGVNVDGYIRRYVELSEELLGRSGGNGDAGHD